METFKGRTFWEGSLLKRKNKRKNKIGTFERREEKHKIKKKKFGHKNTEKRKDYTSAKIFVIRFTDNFSKRKFSQNSDLKIS